jgi:AraC-like DNA-binding protein
VSVELGNSLPFAAERHVEPGVGYQGTFSHCLFSLTLGGGARYHLPSGSVFIQAGDLLCFEPMAWQNWVASEPNGWKVTWVILDLPLAARECMPVCSLGPGIGRVHLTGEDFAEAERAFGIIRTWHGLATPLSERIIANQLTYVLLLSHAQAQQRVELDVRIASARSYLHGRLETPTSLDEVCQAVHLSRARFCALFKLETGVTPLHYLETLRMEEAARRLRFTADSIDDIAQELTYEERKYFDKRFKRHWGVTPYAYRRQSQQRVRDALPTTDFSADHFFP